MTLANLPSQLPLSPPTSSSPARISKPKHRSSPKCPRLVNNPSYLASPPPSPPSPTVALPDSFSDDYRSDNHAYLLDAEALSMANVSPHLIDIQPELRWHMRPFLIDFLVEVHLQSRLRPETLHLAINIVDRYVSRRIVYKRHYQLLGSTSLWIAAKFEDAKDRVPSLSELVSLCSNAYTADAFVQMEAHILQTLGWSLSYPSPESFLRVYATCSDSKSTLHLARFLLDLCLYPRLLVGVPPSVRAFAALSLARTINGHPVCPSSLSSQTLTVVNVLDTELAERVDHVSATLVDKYSRAFYSRASYLVRNFYRLGKRFQSPFSPVLTTPVLQLCTPSQSPVSSPKAPTSAASSRFARCAHRLPPSPASSTASAPHRSALHRSSRALNSRVISSSSTSSLESDDAPDTPVSRISYNVDDDKLCIVTESENESSSCYSPSSCPSSPSPSPTDFSPLPTTAKIAAKVARSEYFKVSQRYAPYQTSLPNQHHLRRRSSVKSVSL